MTTLMLRAVKIYVCDTFQEHANQEHIKKRFVQQLKFLDTIFVTHFYALRKKLRKCNCFYLLMNILSFYIYNISNMRCYKISLLI